MLAGVEKGFSIAEVRNFGDPTEGESQQVILSHNCPAQLGETVALRTGFGRFFSAENQVTCDKCGGSIDVVKHQGTIYLA